MMMSYWGRNLMSFGVDGRITVTPLRFLGDALTAAMTADTTIALDWLKGEMEAALKKLLPKYFQRGYIQAEDGYREETDAEFRVLAEFAPQWPNFKTRWPLLVRKGNTTNE